MLSKINIEFTKMTGSGNDFVLIDNRSGIYNFDWPQLATKICNRHFGVGADGLLVIENSKIANYKMLYYNSDGSSGGMCGNGGRCTASFILNDLGLNIVRFEAFDYIYEARIVDNMDVKLKMKNPISIKTNIQLSVFNKSIPIHYIDTGAPHAVIFYTDIPPNLKKQIDNDGINELGSTIRRHDYFTPDGTNVDFVKILDKSNISIRTFERGVEDETMACGTGSVASAIITSLLYKINSPIKVHTRSNEILIVDFNRDGNDYTEIYLQGSVRKTFTGKFLYED
jgi:diaminopimelate epimerase